MGGLGLLALGNLTGGRWAAVARPYYLAATRTLPIVAVLLIPLAFGLQYIYPWADATSELTMGFSRAKALYLSPPFFLARGAAYLIVWLIVAWWVGRVSESHAPPASRPRMRRAGAVSLVLLVPTTTFAAYDWAMSLEPHWYSSIYGAIVTAGGVVAAHAISLVSLARTPSEVRGSLLRAASREESQAANLINDLGNLLLAFIMVWGYLSFCQFLIIWSANLPSEIVWYERRINGGWQYLAFAIVFIGFVLPFMMLLSRDVKRDVRRVVIVAVLATIGYSMSMYWTIAPALSHVDSAHHVANIAALLGVGGLWIALYSWFCGRLNEFQTPGA